MSHLVALKCPTCGAKLNIAGDSKQFSCDHCGNAYILEHKARDLKPAEREQVNPAYTCSQQLQQWLRVGQYEILVHTIQDENVDGQRLFYADVVYRNNSEETLSCRRGQWVLFDKDGYTYDPAMLTAFYEKRGRPALGGERFIVKGMLARGWVAFTIPPTAVLDRLQFLTGHLTTRTAEFLLNR